MRRGKNSLRISAMKTINFKKYIKNKNYVDVHIQTKFHEVEESGYIMEENDIYILFAKMWNFFYDGFMIIKKGDIKNVVHQADKKHLEFLHKKEKTFDVVEEKLKELDFSIERLDTVEKLFEELYKRKLPLYFVSAYSKRGVRREYGVIQELEMKEWDRAYSNLKLRYLDQYGSYDLLDHEVYLYSITYVQIDFVYTNMLHKYAREVE